MKRACGRASVIVSLCTADGSSVYGDRLVDVTLDSAAAAMAAADEHRRQGYSVIVRPLYNETDATGEYFMEWRSFNGEPFRVCAWRIQ